MSKKKIKKSAIPLIVGIIIIIVLIISGIFYINYRNSYQYKLKNIGYNQDEIKIILEEIKPNRMDKILNLKYNQSLSKIIVQKYFIFDNLDRYISYYDKNKDINLDTVISIVNANADKEFYTNIKKADTSKENLILVNKYFSIGEDYKPNDIVPISNQYSYDGNKIKQEVYDAYKNMWYAAKKEDLTLIVTSSYRDYKFQKELYDNYSNAQGSEWADTVSARPGHSEHQTGLALDIVTYNSTMDNFETTDEFKWLQKNAHKYGFILRYPKGKENITGYSYESWHYRYVGKKVAAEIYEKGITFDEYYAFYLK